MMIKLKLALAASLVAALGAVACGSSSSGSSSSSVFCSVSSTGTNACAGSSSMPAADQQNFKSQCTGQIVSSCPTSGLIGCCTSKSASGYDLESCVYGASSDAGSMGDAGTMTNAAKQACTSRGGKWSTTP